MARAPRAAVAEFDDLFAAHYPAVTRTVYFVLHDRARAEEISQDAFVKLLTHWSRISRYERPDLWVRRVAVRDAVRERRREGRRPRIQALASTGREADPGPDVLGVTHADLTTHLRRLTARQRAVVVLYYLEDLPMDEIARIVDCAPSTAWNHLRAARAGLAEMLGEGVSGDVG